MLKASPKAYDTSWKLNTRWRCLMSSPIKGEREFNQIFT